MIRFAINKYGPIGLDIGSNSIKMLQFVRSRGNIRLAAADKVHCNFSIGDDQETRKESIVDSIKEMLRRGTFKGTKVVSSLPNDCIKIKSLRLDVEDSESIKDHLQKELAERFNFNARRDEIRYITAGKVHYGSEVKNEVIFFASDRQTIKNHISIIEESGLIPQAIDPVPCAIIRSFQRTMRRRADHNIVHSFIDVGNLYTTVIIGSCSQIYFIKQIPTGGKHFNESVSTKLGIGIEEAMLLRSKIQNGNTDSFNNTTIQAVADAMNQGIEELAREISLCYKYYAVTFRGDHPTDAILTGGEAYEEVFVNALKTYLHIDIVTWHPFEGVELGNTSFVNDADSPLCEWTVAAGLGLKKWHVNNYIARIMKEIDLLPKWYKTGKRRRVNYRRQYIIIAGIFITLIAWSFSASLSISIVEAQVEMMQDSLKNNQQIARGFTDLQGTLKKLQNKKTLLEKLDTGVKISSTIAEISYLVGENITLTNLDYKAEVIKPEKTNSGSNVKLSKSSGKNADFPVENVRFKIVIKGVSDNAADVTALIKRLEGSDYLCQIMPVILKNIKNTSAAEFEIKFYVANYIME